MKKQISISLGNVVLAKNMNEAKEAYQESPDKQGIIEELQSKFFKPHRSEYYYKALAMMVCQEVEEVILYEVEFDHVVHPFNKKWHCTMRFITKDGSLSVMFTGKHKGGLPPVVVTWSTTAKDQVLKSILSNWRRTINWPLHQLQYYYTSYVSLLPK
jgi:hypothetical protein